MQCSALPWHCERTRHLEHPAHGKPDAPCASHESGVHLLDMPSFVAPCFHHIPECVHVCLSRLQRTALAHSPSPPEMSCGLFTLVVMFANCCPAYNARAVSGHRVAYQLGVWVLCFVLWRASGCRAGHWVYVFFAFVTQRVCKLGACWWIRVDPSCERRSHRRSVLRQYLAGDGDCLAIGL